MYTTDTANIEVCTVDPVGSGHYVVITTNTSNRPDRFDVYFATSDDGNAMRLTSGSLNMSWADALECAQRKRSGLASALQYWQTHRPSWVA